MDHTGIFSEFRLNQQQKLVFCCFFLALLLALLMVYKRQIKTPTLAFLFCGGLMMLFFSCGHVQKPKEIINTWKVTRIQIIRPDTTDAPSEDYIPAIQLDQHDYQITYTFRQDSTYLVRHYNQTDSGRWVLSSDEKVLLLRSTQNTSDDAEFLIKTFDPLRMTLATEEGGVQELITLESVN